MFKKEIALLESVDFQTFLENALQAAPKSFKEDEELITYTKKVFYITEQILKTDKVTGYVRDGILAGVLLSDIAKNEEDKYQSMHPFLVRPLLDDVKNDLVPQLWEAVLRVVESHEGSDTPIPALQPKPGSAEHLVALANVIARSEKIVVNMED